MQESRLLRCQGVDSPLHRLSLGSEDIDVCVQSLQQPGVCNFDLAFGADANASERIFPQLVFFGPTVNPTAY
jgi:hypothetical protein